MRCSVSVPNLGEFAAPEAFAEVARRTEEAGWDALLVWDHVVGEKDLRWEIAIRSASRPRARDRIFTQPGNVRSARARAGTNSFAPPSGLADDRRR
jgi:hypothetical protein